MTNNFLQSFSQSAGLELLEQEPLVDIVLVCCGGGGFLAGVTAAIRLSGNNRVKIYGVEHMICESWCDAFGSLSSLFMGDCMLVIKNRFITAHSIIQESQICQLNLLRAWFSKRGFEEMA